MQAQCEACLFQRLTQGRNAGCAFIGSMALAQFCSELPVRLIDAATGKNSRAAGKAHLARAFQHENLRRPTCRVTAEDDNRRSGDGFGLRLVHSGSLA